MQKIEIGEHRNKFQVAALEMNRYSGAMLRRSYYKLCIRRR
jgi:hypothetical protein